MKIRNINRTDAGLQRPRGVSPHDGVGDEARVFRKTLTTLSKEQHAAHIQEMKKEIDKQGERLSARVDVRELERYRQLIRDFLDEIVSNGYAFSKENTLASRGRHRFMAMVKTIDTKLDEIGKEVIKDQADSLEVLGKIDDIRGILLDMML